MRILLAVTTMAVAVALSSAAARAQEGGGLGPGHPLYQGAYSLYGAPGWYGTAYGTASYGLGRTWSAYSSSYGAGYGGGYPPTAILPGPYGNQLWGTPAAPAGPGQAVYGSGRYRTIPVPFRADVIPPPIGVYAPGLGPVPTWSK